MVPEWYYAEQGQQRGPVTFDDLQTLAGEGRLKPADLVWKNGWPDWQAASTQAGLFAAPPAAPPQPELVSEWAPAPPAAPPQPELVSEWAPVPSAAPRQSELASESPVPVLVPARAEQLAYDRPFTRLPQRNSSGSPYGALALIGASGLLLVLCIGCGVMAAFLNAGSSSITAATKPSPERTWNLATGQHQVWTLPFNKDDDVTIKVKSDHDSDVDLFVFANEAKMNALLFSGNVERNVGFCVAFDNSPSKDCYVRFVAPQSGNYYVVVANRNSLDQPRRNRANSGKLTFYPVR